MDARSTELDIPAHCADLFDQGSQYYFNGKPDQALTCYESVWLKHPQNEAIIYRYLAAILQNKDTINALALINKSMDDRELHPGIKSRLAYFAALISAEQQQEQEEHEWLAIMAKQYPMANELVASLKPVSPVLAIHTFIALSLLFRLHVLEANESQKEMVIDAPQKEKLLHAAKLWLEEPLASGWALAKLACAQVCHFENNDENCLAILRSIKREECHAAPTLLGMLLASCAYTKEEGLMLLRNEMLEHGDILATFDCALLMIAEPDENSHLEAINCLRKSAEGGFPPACETLGRLVVVNRLSNQKNPPAIFQELADDSQIKLWLDKPVVLVNIRKYSLRDGIELLREAEFNNELIDSLEVKAKELNEEAVDHSFIEPEEKETNMLGRGVNLFQPPILPINHFEDEITEEKPRSSDALLGKNNVFTDNKKSKNNANKARTCGSKIKCTII